MWVNRRSSFMFYIGVLIFLHPTKAISCLFIDRWKLLCASPPVGILYVCGLPTASEQNAGAARPLQARTGGVLRVGGKKGVLWDHQFIETSMEGVMIRWIINKKEKQLFNLLQIIKAISPRRFYSARKFVNANPSSPKLLFTSVSHSELLKALSLCGQAVNSMDTDSHCEVRTTSDMKLSTACQHHFTLWASHVVYCWYLDFFFLFLFCFSKAKNVVVYFISLFVFNNIRSSSVLFMVGFFFFCLVLLHLFLAFVAVIWQEFVAISGFHFMQSFCLTSC